MLEIREYASVHDNLAAYRDIRARLTNSPPPPKVIHRIVIDPETIHPIELPRQLTRIHDIISASCRYYDISRDELLGKRRQMRLTTPRHVAMAVARHLTRRSFTDLGRKFGGRDHTTVMSAAHKMAPVLAAVVPTMAADATPEQWVRAMCVALGGFNASQV
jgi:chromosomal replication initiation ATPase DnaA